MSPVRWMITCELWFLLTDSRLACEDAGCLTTINLKKTGEGVGLCRIAKHLNLSHRVNHTPLRRSRTQDDSFITDLADLSQTELLRFYCFRIKYFYRYCHHYYHYLFAHLKLSNSAASQFILTFFSSDLMSWLISVWFGDPSYTELRSFLS